MDFVLGPPKYIRGNGVIHKIGEYCVPMGRKVFITGGHTALAKTEVAIKISLQEAGIEIVGCEWYGGECNIDVVKKLADEMKKSEADFVIGVGGGKVMDTAKAATYYASLPLVNVPTIAATCAAWTNFSVMYSKQAAYEGVLRDAKCPSIVIADTKIIAEAPQRYLAAGIADTLAKWYEGDLRVRNLLHRAIYQAANYTAKVCKDVMFAYGKEAIDAVGENKDVDCLADVVDAIIMLAGLVNGLGGDECASAIAHGVADGISLIDPKHQVMHGEGVGFGILVQLIAEGEREADINEYVNYCHEIGIPLGFKALALNNVEEVDLREIATVAADESSTGGLPFTIDVLGMIQAIKQADIIANQ